jgi:hypothetical protein
VLVKHPLPSAYLLPFFSYTLTSCPTRLILLETRRFQTARSPQRSNASERRRYTALRGFLFASVRVNQNIQVRWLKVTVTHFWFRKSETCSCSCGRRGSGCRRPLPCCSQEREREKGSCEQNADKNNASLKRTSWDPFSSRTVSWCRISRTRFSFLRGRLHFAGTVATTRGSKQSHPILFSGERREISQLIRRGLSRARFHAVDYAYLFVEHVESV